MECTDYSELCGAKDESVFVDSNTLIVCTIAVSYITDDQRPIGSLLIVLEQPDSRADLDRRPVLEPGHARLLVAPRLAVHLNVDADQQPL